MPHAAANSTENGKRRQKHVSENKKLKFMLSFKEDELAAVNKIQNFKRILQFYMYSV